MARTMSRKILSGINSSLLHTVGYGAAIGTGAAIGGYATGQMTNDASPGMIVGATMGGGLALGSELLVRNADKIAMGIGKKATGVGIGAVKQVGKLSAYMNSNLFAENATAKIMAAKRHVGHMAIGTGKIAGVGASAAVKGGMKYANIVEKMFKTSDKEGQLFKLSGFGKAATAGSAIISGGVKAFQTFNDSRRGVSDGQITTATPKAPVYSSMMRDAGATGDLNFAMHKNRRG